MPIAGGAIAGGAGLGAAIIGSAASSEKAEAAAAAEKAALAQWLKVNVPDPQQQQVELQRYAVTGKLSPQLETAFQQSQTGLKNMAIDPTSRAAEVEALTKMQDLANNGGMDAQSKQQEAQAINTANANERGQRGAIQQDFAARGVGGAGAELAAELSASQGDSNQAATIGMSSAANAEQRALQAMTSSSTMAGTLNSQDYTQAANAAAAQDAINRFNTQNNQSVENSNVGTANNAQAANLANAQNISNMNTGVANTEETHNKGLLQQEFQNEATVAGGAANAQNGVATQANNDATRTANQWAGIGQAVGQGAGAAAIYSNNKNSSANSDDDEE